MKRTRKRKTRTSTATARASKTWLRMSSKSSTTRSMSAPTFQSGLSNTPPKNIAPVGPNKESHSSRVALPVVSSRGWDDTAAGEDLPDEDAFSLSRSGPATVEELDLAPMVDVAFQLVLFFMVAAQTVLYKTLEIPKPTQEQRRAPSRRASRERWTTSKTIMFSSRSTRPVR